MSMPSTNLRCHGCSFEGVMHHRPVRLEYTLPSGETVTGYRQIAWCSTCCNITEAEAFRNVESIYREIAEIEQRNRGIVKRLFGPSQDDATDLRLLQGQLRLAEARLSPPRCLLCEAPTVTPLHFNSSGTSEFRHSCGQRLFLVPQDSNAPRFSFRSQVIRLDAEGRKLPQQ